MTIISLPSPNFRRADEDWRDSAACTETDPELFFREDKDSIVSAKKVCAGCDVRESCEAYFSQNSEQFGVTNALTPDERRKSKRFTLRAELRDFLPEEGVLLSVDRRQIGGF